MRLFSSLLAVVLPVIAQPPRSASDVKKPDLPPAIRGLLQPEIADCLTATGRRIDDAIRVTSTKLSGKNERSWIVEGLGPCLAGANNGPIWVFAPLAGTWRNVLYDIGQTLRKLTNRTNGWYDLELLKHDSAFASIYLVYQFDGSGYQPVRCFVLRFPFEGDDKVSSKPVRERCDWDWRTVEPKTGR